ncbi:hypothetical protein HOT75_gp045 [Gordonia phage Daredevil]|uniref:Uncharacterized protein n=1 Tax=Gordonia phage Daredevil TaxID=2283286 RepID=A0A345MIQ1_9CAUD|nr:hypothetical protein HOT75_gp045 [Gordonia phage Daredevil]AXH70432.1 hypothetical protein SEA_DAREDEVIL_45 [Gordonia phage Daredevil]
MTAAPTGLNVEEARQRLNDLVFNQLDMHTVLDVIVEHKRALDEIEQLRLSSRSRALDYEDTVQHLTRKLDEIADISRSARGMDSYGRGVQLSRIAELATV